MINLPSNLESFVQIMRQGEEFTNYGFELLSKRSDPEKFFDALESSGFFDPSNNLGPIPSSDDPGLVRVPYWPALTYLLAVAKRSGQAGDLVLARKIIAVVRSISFFQDQKGRYTDNYNTYYKFSEILGELPLDVIRIEDSRLIGIWLTSQYDRGLVGRSISVGLLKRLLASDELRDTELAVQVMKECMTYTRQSEGKRRGGDLVSLIDDYFLKSLIDSHATRLGAKAGLRGVQIFEEGLRAIFSDPNRMQWSSIWRPAIEPNPQNLGLHEVENRFVDGMRDALHGWTDASPDEAAVYVGGALFDSNEVIRRIAIYTVTENFGCLRERFEAAIHPSLFSPGVRHELYRLLSEMYSALSAEGKRRIIASLRTLPEPKTGDNPALRLRFIQREWLTAIKDQPEAIEWFRHLSSDPDLGPATEHPDFLSYHESRWGPGPTPFGQDSLIAFAKDGSLVDRLNGFVETGDWKGPTLGGLVSALEATVTKFPSTFFPLLSDFHRAKITFQHALINGFKRVYDQAGNDSPNFDWDIAWSRLMNFFTELLRDPKFWEKPAEGEGASRTRTWMTTLIASFLEAGTKHDETAYGPELLPEGWELVQILLSRAEHEAVRLTDPMTFALNTEKGHAIGALYNHALRVCRIARKQQRSTIEAWESVRPAFDRELAHCVDGNFEFSTLSASYIANLDYMSHEWLSDNIKRLFPVERSTNFKCAIGGLAYASPYRSIYKLLANNEIIDAALSMTFEDRHSRDRVVEWVCLAYLWGDEELQSPRLKKVFTNGAGDIEICVSLFWRVRREGLESEQINRVFAFWEAVTEWLVKHPGSNKLLFSRLSGLVSYISVLDSRSITLLRSIVERANSEYHVDQILEKLSQFTDTNADMVLELLEIMFETYSPSVDLYDSLKNLIKTLYFLGHKDRVIRILEKLSRTLPGMQVLYKELR